MCDTDELDLCANCGENIVTTPQGFCSECAGLGFSNLGNEFDNDADD